MSIAAFEIAIPDTQIEDLRQRLDATRWPPGPGEDWTHGQPAPFVKTLIAHWRDRYDWRAQEAELNALPQFRTEIDGQTVHFVQVKSSEPDAVPLILTHGWPSTFAEFRKVVGLLSEPRRHGRADAIAFDLVIPSVPGYGFSAPLAQPGWDVARVAAAWDVLMTRLGYRRYLAHGCDIGAMVSRELGILAPPGLIGVHLQQIFAFPTGAEGEQDALSAFEREGLAKQKEFEDFAGYEAIQSTRPLTLAYGLIDSPAAQLAWNAELFFGYKGEAAATMDFDTFLTHVSIYWFTATGGSAAHIYYENKRSGAGYRELPNTVPTGVAVFPDDYRSVRAFAERSNNIVHWSEMPRGGHFGAIDAPELLVDDIRAFAAKL